MKKSILIFGLMYSITNLSATDWTYCNNIGGATKIQWVCDLKTAAETGEDGNVVRCVNATLSFCDASGAGDMSKPGFHDVPNLAWYVQGSVGSGNGMMRCQCGCFVGDTRLLLVDGDKYFVDAASTTQPVRIAIPTRDGQINQSEWLTKKDFTVGPEEKVVLTLTTASNESITLTDMHPVLVLKNGEYEMVQARLLQIGDMLIGKSGEETQLINIEHSKLPTESNLVYNVDTRARDSEGHIILANDLQMGDVRWQNILSERSERMKAIRTASIKK